MHTVLNLLHQNGLATKCKSFQTKSELLGYLENKDSVTLPKKIDKIQAFDVPTNRVELECFIGLINYNCDIVLNSSHCMSSNILNSP